jgi:hypothetical protein
MQISTLHKVFDASLTTLIASVVILIGFAVYFGAICSMSQDRSATFHLLHDAPRKSGRTVLDKYVITNAYHTGKWKFTSYRYDLVHVGAYANSSETTLQIKDLAVPLSFFSRHPARSTVELELWRDVPINFVDDTGVYQTDQHPDVAAA